MTTAGPTTAYVPSGLYDEVNDLRRKLNALSQHARTLGWSLPGDRAVGLGIVSEAAEAAEEAIFNVLNVLSSYEDDDAAQTAIAEYRS